MPILWGEGMDKKVKTQKTTERQFQVFKDEAERWADLYGLADWNIEYRKSKLDKEETLADTSWTRGSLVAYIRLVDEADENYIMDTFTLKQAGRHEIDHVLLGEVNDLLEEYVSADVAEKLIHRIIYRLEAARKKLGID